MTPADAAKKELERQIKHFRKLGEGKPNDHEYNVTADGLEDLLIEETDLRVSIDVWTCESYFAGDPDLVISRRLFGKTIADAAKNGCGCLNDDCAAVKVKIHLDNKVIERRVGDEVKKALK